MRAPSSSSRVDGRGSVVAVARVALVVGLGGVPEPFDPHGADLVLGDLGDRVEHRVGEQVGLLAAGPVVGDEHRVGPDRLDDLGRHGHLAAPRRDPDEVAGRDPERSASRGCSLDQRLGVLVDQRADPAGLGARQELADDPPGRQPQRVVGVDLFGGGGRGPG
jgi:hypothetical protein